MSGDPPPVAGGLALAADAAPAGGYAQHWARWHADHPGETEWHLEYGAVRGFLSPYLLQALSGAGGEPPCVMDAGCGTSTWGQSLLEEHPAALLVLVDVAEPLVESLREAHAADARVRCVLADCRRLGELGLGPVDVVLDKGTADALDSRDEQEAMLRGALGLLRRPSGLLISVAFAAAARVLLLRRVAKEMGLELLLRVVPARSEKRLVALLAESFSGVPSVEQDADALASELWLDGLLYAAPLRGEPFISFERPPLPTPLVIRQESAKDRLGTSEDATGGLVWPSAHALSAHLCARPELVRGRRVVELGAGTGLVGLVAAALGAEEVVLTDLPSALPLLQENVTRNASACGGRARTATLSWGAAGAEDVLRSLGGRCHVVIGCEIVYQHDEVTSAALAETMSLLAGADGICLFAYEFREGLLGDFEFFDRVNERFNVEVESLAPYGFGAQQRSDDMDRLLYVYRPTSVA